MKVLHIGQLSFGFSLHNMRLRFYKGIAVDWIIIGPFHIVWRNEPTS